MPRRPTFDTPKSKETLEKIVKMVCGGFGTTNYDIYKATRLSERRIAQYLTYASEQQKKIHRLPRPPRTGNGGSVRDLWVGGPAPEQGEPEVYEEDNTDYAQRKVMVRTKYPPNRARDPYHLPAEFFASAQQRNEQ